MTKDTWYNVDILDKIIQKQNKIRKEKRETR